MGIRIMKTNESPYALYPRRSVALALVALLGVAALSATAIPAAADTCSIDVVSDAATTASGTGDPSPHAAVIVDPPWPGAWAGIPGGSFSPRFIWYQSPAADDTQGEFTRSIPGCLLPWAGTLYVNGDQAYQAFWNGELVAECIPAEPLGMECFQSYTQSRVVINPGSNELRIVGSNPSSPDQTPEQNPAMVQFRVAGDGAEGNGAACLQHNPSALTNVCIEIGESATDVPSADPSLTGPSPLCIVGPVCVPVYDADPGIGSQSVPIPDPYGYVELTAACGVLPEACRITLP